MPMALASESETRQASFAAHPESIQQTKIAT